MPVHPVLTIFYCGLLLLVAVSGCALVRTRDVTAQTLGLSFYGIVFALLFFVLQAPDVALSQITVGAVALPLMIMLAISRMRAAGVRSRSKSDE